MSRFKNPGVVPQGMLAPSAYRQDHLIDPVVQSTVRPAGTLLRSSPGYASIRRGKNRFQGKGPTGGFRPMQFAEDVGGSGAVLSVIPGDTTAIDATEWLPEGEDSFHPGDMIVADREHFVGIAGKLHEAFGTIPDMGDRHPGRPLSKSRWLVNPVGMFRADFRESPAITVAATAGLILLIAYVVNDAERQFRSRRSSGVIGTAAAVPGAAVATTGDTGEDVVQKISETGDRAVKAIERATDEAVGAIKDTAESAKQTVTGE